MAQKVTVALEDDLTGSPAAETLRFAFDGTDYEIDLNAKNGTAFRKQLATLCGARPQDRAGTDPPGRTARVQPPALG
jgi:nucleoid-associated protein Lsr2